MSAESAAIDVQTELVAASRERVGARLSSPERLTHGVTAAVFLANAVAYLIALTLALVMPRTFDRNAPDRERESPATLKE